MNELPRIYFVQIKNGRRWSIAGCMPTAQAARRLVKFLVEGRAQIKTKDIRIK